MATGYRKDPRLPVVPHDIGLNEQSSKLFAEKFFPANELRSSNNDPRSRKGMIMQSYDHVST